MRHIDSLGPASVTESSAKPDFSARLDGPASCIPDTHEQNLDAFSGEPGFDSDFAENPALKEDALAFEKPNPDEGDLEVAHDEAVVKAAVASTEAITDDALLTAEVTIPACDATTLRETLAPFEDYAGNSSSPAQECNCLVSASEPPSDVECSTSCSFGPAFVTAPCIALTVSGFSVSVNEPRDSSIRGAYEDKEHPDAASEEARPVPDLAEESRLKDNVKDSVNEGFVSKSSSDRDLQVEGKPGPVVGTSELSATATEGASDSADMLSVPRAPISDAARQETPAALNGEESSVASEPVHLAVEEPDSVRDSATTVATDIELTAEVTEAPCEHSSSAAAPEDLVQLEATENSSELHERVNIHKPSRITIRRKALAYRARFRALPFDIDKYEDDEDEEKYFFSTSSDVRLGGATEPPASEAATQEDNQAPSAQHQQRTPEEEAAYFEKAKQLALRYFWREKFLFVSSWVTRVRRELDQEDKKVLTALQRRKVRHSWMEERNPLRRSVYSVFVKKLGYVVTNDPELRRNSLEPIWGGQGNEGCAIEPQAESFVVEEGTWRLHANCCFRRFVSTVQLHLLAVKRRDYIARSFGYCLFIQRACNQQTVLFICLSRPSAYC